MADRMQEQEGHPAGQALFGKIVEAYHAVREASYTTSPSLNQKLEATADELAEVLGDLRDTNDLDVLAVWEGGVQYLRVHLIDDEDSPDGQAFDVQSFEGRSYGSWSHYDAGVLWGYASAKDAAEAELGFEFDPAAATFYDISRSDIAFRIEETAEYHSEPFTPVTHKEVLAAIKDLEPVSWADVGRTLQHPDNERQTFPELSNDELAVLREKIEAVEATCSRLSQARDEYDASRHSRIFDSHSIDKADAAHKRFLEEKITAEFQILDVLSYLRWPDDKSASHATEISELQMSTLVGLWNITNDYVQSSLWESPTLALFCGQYWAQTSTQDGQAFYVIPTEYELTVGQDSAQDGQALYVAADLSGRDLFVEDFPDKETMQMWFNGEDLDTVYKETREHDKTQPLGERCTAAKNQVSQDVAEGKETPEKDTPNAGEYGL